MTQVPPTPPPADPAPRPRRRRLHLPPRRTIFRIISWTVGALLAIIVILGIWVYRESVGRFQVRKLRLPTRIYADYTPLAAGTALRTDDLLEKLDRLGYRQVPRLSAAGEYTNPEKGVVDIYTRQFNHPTGDYPPMQLRVTVDGGLIESVSNLREPRPIEQAALEPELLTSVL